MAEIMVHIVDDRTDPEQLDELTLDLFDAVRAGPVERVNRRSVPGAPDGARGTDWLEAGVLVVQVALEAGLLDDVVRRIDEWRGRRQVAAVQLTVGDARLVVAEASPEQQQKLIDHFVHVTSGAGR